MITIALGVFEAMGGMYGMNVVLPGENYTYMFGIIVLINFALIVGGYLVLKHKKML